MVKAAHDVVTKTIQTDNLCDVSQKKSNPEIVTFIMVPIHDGDCGQCPHRLTFLEESLSKELVVVVSGPISDTLGFL